MVGGYKKKINLIFQPQEINETKAINYYDYGNIQKTAQSFNKMYVSGDTLFLAGTDWSNAKDHQANIYNSDYQQPTFQKLTNGQ